jgi:predicted DNA-binding protein YlxM (UPF0122 family)
MTEEDLINLKDRSPVERAEIARQGGLVKSEKKTLANITKNLKHGKYARKFSLMVQELAKNPDVSAFKIFDLINRIEAEWEELNPKLKIDLAKLYCEARKTVHGIKQTNVNVDIELKKDLEKWFYEKAE